MACEFEAMMAPSVQRDNDEDARCSDQRGRNNNVLITIYWAQSLSVFALKSFT